MPRSSSLLFVALGLTALTASSAAAQRAPLDRPTYAVATLPESNEAMLVYSEFEEALQRGDFRLAIRLTERIQDVKGELVAAPGGRTYYPIWQQAARMLRQLPAEGARIYRQLYDAEVRQRLEAAAARADLAELRLLFQKYPLSSEWPRAGKEMLTLLIDRGAFAEAVEVLKVLETAEAEAGPLPAIVQLQAVVSYAQLGALAPARDRLERLREHPDVQNQPRWTDRLAALQKWLAGLNQPENAPPAVDPLMALRLAPIWSQKLTPADPVVAAGLDDDHQVADAAESRRRPPLPRAVTADGVALVRGRGALWAFDALTLSPRWRELDSDPFRPDESGDDDFSDGEPRRLSPDAELLLNHVLRHRLSVGFGKVYTVEGLTLPEAPRRDFRPRFRRRSDTTQAPNELVARDLATGRVLWRIGRSPSHPLYGVAFQDVPVAAGDRLIVPIKVEDDLRLCALDPVSGAVKQNQLVLGPPTFFGAEGGRCQAIADETTLYLLTGNGVVAALGRDDLSWKWATTYASSLAERRNVMGFLPGEAPREFTCEPLLLCEDLLILAPLDSPNLFAVDRHSGRQRWFVERAPYTYLAGITAGGLLLAGDGLMLLDVRDGQTLRWRSAPLEISGRPALHGTRIYLPTRSGIVTLDALTGKLLSEGYAAAAMFEGQTPASHDADEDQAGRTPGEVLLANLTLTEDGLIGVSPNRIIKYADGDRLERRCRELLTRDPKSARLWLSLGWAEVMRGRFAEALAVIEGHPTDESALQADRDALLSTVFVELSRNASTQAERLDWLRRAQQLCAGTDMAARLIGLIGEVLEDARQWPGAAAHYAEAIVTAPLGIVHDSANARQLVPWLYAAQRLTRILPRLNAAEQDEVFARALELAMAPNATASALRLLEVMAPGAAQERLKRVVLVAGLPPELAQRHIVADDATAPLDLRIRAWLARWETHVALAQLTAAGEDRETWERNFAESASPEQTRQAERIKASAAKLARHRAPPLRAELIRQWRLAEDVALILAAPHATQADAVSQAASSDSALAADPGDFFLARGLQNGTLELRSTIAGRSQRVTHDHLGVDVLRDPGEVEVDVTRRAVLSAMELNAWPMVRLGELAAVPTSGGLIGLGLGPERRGESRLWEAAIPDWSEFPTDFSVRAAALPSGICLAPTPDRLMLLSWLDGKPLWQRTMVDAPIRELLALDGRVVLLTNDQQLYSVDARFGGGLRRVAPQLNSAAGMKACGDMLIVWTADEIAGLAGPRFEVRWRRAQRALAELFVTPVLGWFATRMDEERRWTFCDAQTGAEVWPAALETDGSLAAVTRTADRVYLGLNEAAQSEEGEARPPHGARVRLMAVQADTGARIWEWTAPSPAPLHPSQLSALPDYIPVLTTGDGIDLEQPAIVKQSKLVLLSKTSGDPARDPLPIGDYFDDKGQGRELSPLLIATPTRIVVQMAGIVVGFGSPAADEP